RAGGQEARDRDRVEMCAEHPEHRPGRLGRDGLAAMDHGEQACHLVGRGDAAPPTGGGVRRDAAGQVEHLAVQTRAWPAGREHANADGANADLVNEQVRGGVVAERDQQERGSPDRDLERRGEVLEQAGAGTLVHLEHDDGVLEAEATVLHLVENFHENRYLDDTGRGERLVAADAERVAGGEVDDGEADDALVPGDSLLDGGPEGTERLLRRGGIRRAGREEREGEGHCERESRAEHGASVRRGRGAGHRDRILFVRVNGRNPTGTAARAQTARGGQRGSRLMEYVRQNERVAEVAERVGEADLVAADTEAAGYHRYHDRVCLLQLATRTATFVVDTLVVTDLTPLAELFAAPQLEVVFHDA